MVIKCVAARVQILLLLLCLAPLPSHKCDDINPTTPQPAPCPEVLSVGIPEDEYRLEDDGGLVHRDRTYPVGSHWHDGNWTRGCVCHVAPKPCLRKCCASGEILSTSLSRLDPCQPDDAGGVGAEDELKLDPQRTTSSMRHQLTSRPSIHDWFTLFKPSSQVCAEKFVFMDLNPDKYPEDAHVLHENGSLYMESTGLLDAERFCVDRQMGRTGLTVIVCLEQTEPEEETSTVVRIGYVLSVPFLAVTFLVYAIIPELRNIYGKTLMCYVFALLSAYSTIFATNFVEFSTVCHILDKRSNRVKRSTADCGDHEFFNSCGSTCERNCDDINNDDRFGERCTGKLDCVEKCVCKEGYVRENLDGKCIRIQECPRVKH